jgi:hypothetical protein
MLRGSRVVQPSHKRPETELKGKLPDEESRESARSNGRLRVILVRGLALSGIRLVVGLGASVGLNRVLSALLYKVAPTDPRTLAGVCGGDHASCHDCVPDPHLASHARRPAHGVTGQLASLVGPRWRFPGDGLVLFSDERNRLRRFVPVDQRLPKIEQCVGVTCPVT